MTGMDMVQQLLEENEYSAAQINQIRVRLGDWFLSGGGPDDEYVWRQARYLENLVKYGLVKRTSVQREEVNYDDKDC